MPSWFKSQTFTGSERAAKMLAHWRILTPKFVKVMPKDYKRVLQALQRVKLAGNASVGGNYARWDIRTADASGQLDLAGFKRPQSYYRDIVWEDVEAAVRSPERPTDEQAA